MRKLIVDLKSKESAQDLLKYLAKMNDKFSINLTESNDGWYNDIELVERLNERSSQLKNGVDKGLSFSDIRSHMVNHNLNSQNDSNLF